MAYRTQEQLPELLAALAPKLAPLELSLHGDVLRIRDPRRADRFGLVASWLIVGVPAALVGIVVSWFAHTSWWRAAGFAFVIGGLLGAVYEAMMNRPSRSIGRRARCGAWGPTDSPIAVGRFKPPGADAMNEQRQRLGLAPIDYEMTADDVVRTSLDILDLLS
jgi:hypothetical protein